MFCASNRWICDKYITPVDNFLKDTKVLSRIAGPVGALFDPTGAIAGTIAGAVIGYNGYGKKPCRLDVGRVVNMLNMVVVSQVVIQSVLNLSLLELNTGQVVRFF